MVDFDCLFKLCNLLNSRECLILTGADWWVGRLLPTGYYRPMVSLGFIYFAFATFLFPVTSVGISAWHCDFLILFFIWYSVPIVLA